jgi:hypothetical protein
MMREVLRHLGHSKKRLAQPETLHNSQGLSHLESAEMQRERRALGPFLFRLVTLVCRLSHFRFPMEALYFPEHFVKTFGLV